MGRGQGNGRLFAAVSSGDLGFQALHGIVGIKAQIVRIGADETDDISPTRQGFDVALFDGLEIRFADLEDARDVRQVFAFFLARLTQIPADAFERRITVADNFA